MIGAEFQSTLICALILKLADATPRGVANRDASVRTAWPKVVFYLLAETRMIN